MARLIIAVAAITLAAVVGSTASAQQALTGSWRGYWTKANDTMPVVLTASVDPAGHAHGSFSAERLRVSNIPFADIQLTGCCDVVMTLRGDRTTTVFTGRISGDSLTGALVE